MKLTLAEPRYLRESISAISELVNEVKLKVNKDMVEIVAMDPANVAMVIFKLLSSTFIDYDVKKDYELCISLDHLKNIVRRAKPSDIITLKFDENKNKLNILLKGDSERHFSLGLLDDQGKEQKIPDLKFSANIETSALQFGEAIDDLDIVSDSINFIIDDGKFVLQGDGTTSSGRIEFGEGTKVVNKTNESIKEKNSLEYLKKIAKAGKLSGHVGVYFGKDYPMMIEYKVVDKLVMKYILAPRVSND